MNDSIVQRLSAAAEPGDVVRTGEYRWTPLDYRPQQVLDRIAQLTRTTTYPSNMEPGNGSPGGTASFRETDRAPSLRPHLLVRNDGQNYAKIKISYN